MVGHIVKSCATVEHRHVVIIAINFYRSNDRKKSCSEF